MEIAHIDGATRVLGESQGYRGLPIVDTMFGDAPAMVSEWVPSAGERAAIASGKSLFLWLLGTQHPPVMMTVENDRCPLTVDMFA
ncbi:hypothetical protein CO659_12880 [Rhizobium sp. S9]|nr:hypothetical protein CO659_12880 [Rhizobium sp. S9]